MTQPPDGDPWSRARPNEGYPPAVPGPVPPPAGWPAGHAAGPGSYAPQEVCAFHPNRPTSLHCTRCGRPACPECLTPASVGFQCKACIAQARGTVRHPRNVSGSRLGQQPIVTSTLIAINVIVYVVTVVQAKSPDISASSAAFREGALIPDLVAHGEYWRVITSGFLHLSLIHIGANMLSLYFVGLPLERVLGRWRFATVYFLSLLGGSALALFASGGASIEAGASGAIFGIMGALLVTFRRLRLDPRQLLVWIGLNLIITFTNSGISWQAHVGGFLVGAAAGAIMVYPKQEIRKTVQMAGSAGLAVVLVVVIAVYGVVHKSQFCDIGYGFIDGQQGTYLTYCGRGT